MGTTLGNLQAGPQWADLFLDGEAGDSLSICLAEEVDSDSEWECFVRARTNQGTYHVGAFRTRSPARGEIPARLVATAYFPGAIGWITSWRLRSGTNPQAAAECTLASRDCCGGGPNPGVTPVLSEVVGPNASRSFQRQPLVGNPSAPEFPVTSVPGSSVYRAEVSMNKPESTGHFYAMLLDIPLGSVPVGGETPFWQRPIGTSGAPPSGTTDPFQAFEGGPQGFRVTGIAWAVISSDGASYVPSGENILTYSEISQP